MFRILALLLALSACSAVDRGTVGALAQLDPLTADPAAVAARIDLPPGLTIPPAGAGIQIAARRADTGATLGGRFVLSGEGGIWRLTPSDADRLRRLQETAARWKAEAPEATSGSLSVSVAACRTGDGPAAGATLSVELSLDAGASFHPLIRDLPATAALKSIADVPGTCPDAG